METILTIIIASGILGFAANWFVNVAKYARDYAGVSRIDPRIVNAVVSLVLAFVTVIAGGDVSQHELQAAFEVLVTAGLSFGVAHFTHRANSI
jgi:positive regulator of sigma E activity